MSAVNLIAIEIWDDFILFYIIINNNAPFELQNTGCVYTCTISTWMCVWIEIYRIAAPERGKV